MTKLATLPNLADEISDIYLGRAGRPYGLYGINQLQHALQSAMHAERAGLSSAMVMACLLHDVGHMIHGLGEAPAEKGVDDRHEALGADWLARRFPEAVFEPVRLHVQAKRYLCAAEPEYERALASDSRLSLALQGGALSREQQAQFLQTPFADQAIRLRRIDELAKDKNAVTPDLTAFLDRHLEAALS